MAALRTRKRLLKDNESASIGKGNIETSVTRFRFKHDKTGTSEVPVSRALFIALVRAAERGASGRARVRSLARGRHRVRPGLRFRRGPYYPYAAPPVRTKEFVAAPHFPAAFSPLSTIPPPHF